MKMDMPTQEQIDAYVAKKKAEDLVKEKKKARLKLTCAALAGACAHLNTGTQSSSRIAYMSIEAADACLRLLYPTEEEK